MLSQANWPVKSLASLHRHIATQALPIQWDFFLCADGGVYDAEVSSSSADAPVRQLKAVSTTCQRPLHFLLPTFDDLRQLPDSQPVGPVRPGLAARHVLDRLIGNRHVELFLQLHYEFHDIQFVRTEFA